MRKYIIGGAIILLVWLAAIIFRFQLKIAALISLVVALVVLLLVGLEKLKERRAARDLEKALAQQAARQAATARPDLQHEIAEMNAEFSKAVAALKTSKKGGKKALYALPWYAIIGPPGCGKSTALRNSGLQFPYLSASGGGVRGLGGTRNCDWWMTSEGVILDTAGRWTSEDEDRDEWLAFLDLIKQFRPQKPLNGIIAAVSVGDLGGAREEEVVNLARRVRERIDEVQGRLQMSLPVYVLFTKCDLIPGFVETFGELTKEDRGQVWGFTAPLTKAYGTPGEYFARGFDELLGVLDRRAAKRMGEERKIANREMIYAFPQQIAVIQQNLQEFVHNLFLENVFKETPRLRGVYFTSGTQEGRPIDRVMSRMAEAFGQPQVQLPAPQVEAKSYFLRDMFSNVVFRDASVAVRSPEEVARQRRNTYIVAAAIFGVAVGISGLPAISWANNRNFLEETRAALDESRELMSGQSDEPVRPEELDRLRSRVALLERHCSSTPVHLAMGLFQEGPCEPMSRLYSNVFKRRVIEPLIHADVLEMDALGRSYETGSRPQPHELRAAYHRLKLHLLMSTPKDPDTDEPTNLSEEEHRTFAERELVQRWSTAVGLQRSHPQYERIRRDIRYYLRRMSQQEELSLDRDVAAVDRVRGVFAAQGSLEVAVQAIIEEAQVRSHSADMNLTRLLRRNIVGVRASERVRYAFTRDGWERHVRGMLDNEAARFFGEPWVLGQPPPEDTRQAERERACQVEALKSMFLNRYVEEWRRFIASIVIDQPPTEADALTLLRQLTGGGDPLPMTDLVRSVNREVTLEQAPAPTGGGRPSATQRAAEGMVNRRLEKTLGGGASRRVTGAVQNDVRSRLGGSGGLNCPAITDEMAPGDVRTPFIGFIEFAVAPPVDSQGTGQSVTPAAVYEEHLGHLRTRLQARVTGTSFLDYDTQRTESRAVLDAMIAERPEEWRERFRTLLGPPIEGAPQAARAPTPAPPPPTPNRRRR